MAPAGVLRDATDITCAEEACRALGWHPEVGPNAGKKYGYLAGTDDERLADVNAAIRDPAVDGIWCLRGGFGVTRILEHVDFDAFGRSPKVLVGYSDITALLNAVTRITAVVTFHGPIAREAPTPFSREHLERLTTEPASPAVPLNLSSSCRPTTLRSGVATGPLLGGNLSLLQCLVGTPYFPDLDGALLFLEDVAEDAYRIDRMLAHLRMVGAFDGLSGVVVGQLGLREPASDAPALRIDQILETSFGPLGVPVAAGFPIGHVDDQWTLPLGVPARLDATAGTLTILEPAVC